MISFRLDKASNFTQLPNDVLGKWLTWVRQLMSCKLKRQMRISDGGFLRFTSTPAN